VTAVDEHVVSASSEESVSLAARASTREGSSVLVLGCIAEYQTALRSRALRLGHRLFIRRPKVFRKSVDSWWHGKRGKGIG